MELAEFCDIGDVAVVREFAKSWEVSEVGEVSQISEDGKDG